VRTVDRCLVMKLRMLLVCYLMQLLFMMMQKLMLLSESSHSVVNHLGRLRLRVMLCLTKILHILTIRRPTIVQTRVMHVISCLLGCCRLSLLNRSLVCHSLRVGRSLLSRLIMVPKIGNIRWIRMTSLGVWTIVGRLKEGCIVIIVTIGSNCGSSSSRSAIQVVYIV